jgi:hypothetical protein
MPYRAARSPGIAMPRRKWRCSILSKAKNSNWNM